MEALDPMEALTQVRSPQKFFTVRPTIRGSQIAQADLSPLPIKRV